MTTAPTDQLHPVVRAVDVATRALTGAVDVPLWSLDASQLRRLVTDLARLASTLTAVEAGVLAHADRAEVAQDAGATSTASWLALETRLTRAEAHRRLRLARDVEAREASAAALAAGAVVPEQVRVILDAVAAVEGIPDDLAELRGVNRAELAAAAEARLLEEAASHDAKALRVLGRHILDVVAPELAEEHERRLLEDEERRAREMTRLTMSEDGQGLVHGRFTLPALAGSMLRKALLGLMAPKHQAARGGGPGPVAGRPSPARLGAAFCEYVERYPVDRLPHAGGVAASVVVTVGLDQLREALGSAAIDDGGRISATEARRLACEAGIIPAVLGGAGRPLDVGRRNRFHTEPQRIAIAIRDGCCTAEGCDWPPGLCHVHHDVPWSQGGRTSVADGRLLCPKHHAMVHDPQCGTTRSGTGKLRFTRRT
jgi:hypothetical protein